MAVLKRRKRTQKKCFIKQNIESEDFKKRLESNKALLRSEQRFRSELHTVFPERINKIAFSANDNKRPQMLQIHMAQALKLCVKQNDETLKY